MAGNVGFGDFHLDRPWSKVWGPHPGRNVLKGALSRIVFGPETYVGMLDKSVGHDARQALV
ncbi:MAG TPA: hypothetical protein VIH87_02705 [Methylocella sp.]